MATDVEMVALFKAELEMCKVKPGEVVAVLSEGEVRADYAYAFLTAAQELGATPFHLGLPAKPIVETERQTGKTPLADNRPAIEALKGAGLIVDLMGLLFSREQIEMTDAGARVLMVLEPVDVLRQMFPTKDQRRRVEFGAGLIEKAKVLHITSGAGTDIRYGLSQYPVLTEYGYTDTPGRWDHWPSGFLLTQGNDGEVDGTVVLMPGDILNEFRSYVQSPVKLTVKRGVVTDIAGEGIDASFLKSYIESFQDDRAYAISHIGWGLNERAKWHHWQHTRNRAGEIGMNALAFYGNVLFSLGPNTEVGGTNDTACHLDMPMRNCTLTLDGEPVVVNGQIVREEMRVAGL